MKRNEILNTFRMLARSQGFYGRILAAINEMSEEQYEDFMGELEAQNFADSVELVIFMECEC